MSSAGFGLAPLILNPIQTEFINPLNLPPDKYGYFTDSDLLDQVVITFPLLGGIYLVLQLVACIFLVNPPIKKNPDINVEENEQKLKIIVIQEDGSEKMKDDLSQEDGRKELENKENKDAGEDNFSVMLMFKTREFYILTFTMALSFQSILFMIAMTKAYGQTYIKDDFFLSVVTALTGVTNSVSQPIWGLLLDKTSYKDCMASVNALLTAFMLTFYATPYGYKIMFTVWVLAIEFVMSAVFVLIPAACAKVYGAKHSGTSVGFVFIFPSMSCVLGALAIQYIQDSFGWFGSFGFISSLTFMAFIATLFFPEREKVKKVQGELREPKQ
ncbi:apicoplast pyruvate carrier 1-like isoform X1 [Tachypleus tridentatus]|uniref:apicoplast pyruvate carrier 1-like isoform X1 n=2 Tax=Tachypleus tridentatus TaxID=6853 RepID=UPI003FD61EE5